MSAKPSRRVFARFPCDLPIELCSPMTGHKLCDGRMVDLSMGGASIEAPINIQKGVPYEVRLTWDKQLLQLTGRVAWEAPPNKKTRAARRYGISFNITTKQEAVLRQLIDRLRQDHWPAREDVSRDYWSV